MVRAVRCWSFVEGEDVGCDALEEEKETLEKDVPNEPWLQDTSVVPEYLCVREVCVCVCVQEKCA